LRWKRAKQAKPTAAQLVAEWKTLDPSKKKDRRRMRAILETARRMKADEMAMHGGRLFPSSLDIITRDGRVPVNSAAAQDAGKDVL
jgi:hypothetical protein